MTDSAFPTPELTESPERHLVVVRETVPMDRIPDLYDRAFPLIFGALGAAQVTPVAAPMGVIHGVPGDSLDLSVAVPVAEPFAAVDAAAGLAAETLPAAKVATLMVSGDYSRLADAYGHLYGWLAENGLEAGDIAWEQYLTEPEPGGDPAANETLIGVHLKELE
ncbi:GyrI-like domain-containing protein [Leucobacter coleopterorum]|uniref:GyrI-like domain-containing protein n=1 Tax=Leucobacter coleopterorum TaxID=2714933 RepID=A0ABX6JW31_9MICO|nr:GyrI-like domain-containing protein [Leucobacter coleopterorum]QIM18453.1 GyrI-like domain-containing protein [Leucobacter coleopterorum]